MTEKKIASYGSWQSPITSDVIVTGTVGIGEVALRGAAVYWVESRPAEAGRSVLVQRAADGQTKDLTPPPFNLRTRVHEYGGGAFLVADDGTIYFSNFADNRLYVYREGEAIKPLTADRSPMRYADFCLDARRKRLLCVREDHSVSDTNCTNTIVAIDLESGADKVLIAGNDFYAAPRLSGDGRQLAWLTWNHPSMPWDGTQLWLAEVSEDGALGDARCVAGGVDESIFQPEWSPDGVLHFASDRTDWWQLYRLRDGQIERVSEPTAGERKMEIGAPQWVFGMSLYQFVTARQILCAYNEQGNWHLATLDTESRELRRLELPFSDIRNLRVGAGQALFCAGSPTAMDALIRVNLDTCAFEVLQQSSQAAIDEGYLSIAEAIEFPTENGQTAHAFYYAPKNREYAAPQGERPPLIVISHGGPTAATSSTLSLRVQYWTSRGFAVVDVNYGGSTGYGRAYRQRLNGNWGIVDVDDSVNAARYLVAQEKADGDRVIIRGGSAGGYTTLAALTFRDFFKAGASYYGISDLEALEQDCHKFESRYNSSLIAPYPAAQAIYQERSPIHHTERLSCPIILFQGLDDKVVPPNQSEMMVAALRAKRIPVAYIAFEGEGHGFRKAANIKRTLDAELYFYARVFGFAADVPPDAGVDEAFSAG